MQGEAHAPEKFLSFLQQLQLRRREKIVIHQFIEAMAAEMAPRNPADHLNVAQAAGATLDIRFEFVRRVVVSVVARLLFVALRQKKTVGGPHSVRSRGRVYSIQQCRRAAQQPGFH
jgi:hypothetical protein